jgi:hypothetical protein
VDVIGLVMLTHVSSECSVPLSGFSPVHGLGWLTFRLLLDQRNHLCVVFSSNKWFMWQLAINQLFIDFAKWFLSGLCGFYVV